MIEFMLYNNYANFVGIAITVILAKIVGFENLNRIASKSYIVIPILAFGATLSLLAYAFFGVPIIVYSWHHAIIPFWNMCHQFWF